MRISNSATQTDPFLCRSGSRRRRVIRWLTDDRRDWPGRANAIASPSEAVLTFLSKLAYGHSALHQS